MVSPIPNALDDPTEMEIKGAADKLATMMNSSQPQANVFFQPENLGAQEKFARLFMSIAAELWVRDVIDTVEVFAHAPATSRSGLPKHFEAHPALLTIGPLSESVA